MRIPVLRITFFSLEKDHMVFHAKFKPLLFDKFPRIKSVLYPKVDGGLFNQIKGKLPSKMFAVWPQLRQAIDHP